MKVQMEEHEQETFNKIVKSVNDVNIKMDKLITLMSTLLKRMGE